MKERIRRKHSESGSALIAVLCLLFTAGMLTTTVLMISRTATFDIYSHVELQRSDYINEGASNRIQWLIAADRQLFPGRDPGITDYTEYTHDRYLADGVIHELDYYGYKLKFTITDARAGLDLNSQTFNTQLRNLVDPLDAETDFSDQIDQLIALITDYRDTDYALSLDGMERDDYELEGRSPLPRNRPMVVREEFYYIKGFTDLLPPDSDGRLTQVRLFGAPTGNPDFFTATPRLLQRFCNLEDEQVEEVVNARNIWFRERTCLKDQLDPFLLDSLTRLSWQESGTYTVRIAADETTRRPSRRLVFTFRGFAVSGENRNNVSLLEWQSF